ncbi:MAG: 30S ribosomal protein S6 [bacterium]
MKSYELAVILRADKEETEVKRDVEGIRAFLEKIDGCEVVNMDPWNRRKLAYPIEKQIFGFYVIFDLKASPTAIQHLREELALNTTILRFMVVAK